MNRPYSLLPGNKNILKHFPVNWKFQNGLIGGMKVYTQSNTAPQTVLKRLLAQQAGNCKGRSATEREQPLTLKSGRVVQRARGICELPSGSVLSMRYRATRPKNNYLMVIMHVGAKKQFGKSKKPGSTDL